MVNELETLDAFQAKLKSTRILIVDFYALWCGPCRQVAPEVEKLASKYPKFEFAKVDVDKVEISSIGIRIGSIPTFCIYLDGVEKHRVEGADMALLSSQLEGLDQV